MVEVNTDLALNESIIGMKLIYFQILSKSYIFLELYDRGC